MSGPEIWQKLLEFLDAVPPWVSALPIWLTTLVTLALGFWIGRMGKSRATKLLEQKAAQDALQLAVEAIKIDPTFRAVPGLGQAVLDQLKRQKRLKVPPELARRLKGEDVEAVPSEPPSATVGRQAEPETRAEVQTASAASAGDDAAPDVGEKSNATVEQMPPETEGDGAERTDSDKGALSRRNDH